MLSACRRSARPAEGESSGLIGVTVQAARVENLRDVASASGTVVPSSAADWVVLAPETGQVASLPVKEGDVVNPGAVLVRFEIASATQELAALQLEVLEAAGRVDRAKADLGRKTMLYERGMMSRNDYEASRLDQATAESLLAQAQTRFEAAQTTQDRTVVRAPFGGKVVKVWHGVGDQVVGLTEPILRVIDPTRVQVSVQLPVAQLARIVPGQVATVRAIAGAGDEPATVATKPDSTDPTAPTGEVRLAFTNAATLPLDTPVSVEIMLDQRSGALVVPTASVKRAPTSAYVMVAGEDSRAHQREVRVGLSTRELTQITSGLEAGEHVIVGGLDDVNDGSAIVMAR